MKYIGLHILFFLFGVGLDFFYAKWTKRISELSYKALSWAYLWGLTNLTFVGIMAKYEDWFLGHTFCLGIVIGSWLMIRNERKCVKFT